MPGNIFLIGPMGAGKSTIGRQLASLTKKTFLDADKELESRTGVSIPLIFEIEGEEGFRKRESDIIDELTRQNELVLATGGGAVLNEANRRALHSRGVVVYLAATIDTLVDRTRHDKNRPLLQNVDRRQKFEELMEQRDPLYRQEADIIVDTDNRSPAAVAKDIVKRLEQQNAL